MVGPLGRLLVHTFRHCSNKACPFEQSRFPLHTPPSHRDCSVWSLELARQTLHVTLHDLDGATAL